MAIEKICLTHKVAIKSSEDEQKHMGPECILITQGSGLGEIEGVPQAPGMFSEEMSYEAGVILPYDTEEQKQGRMKQLGTGKLPKDESK